MSATPRPWVLDSEDERYGRTAEQRRCYIWTSKGPGYGAIAHLTGPNNSPQCVAENADNAELIVRAVNAHDALVEALRKLVDEHCHAPTGCDAHKEAMEALRLAGVIE